MLCALRALCGEIPTPWPGGKDADFITLRHTIVYRSRYQIAPGSIFTGIEAKKTEQSRVFFQQYQLGKTDIP